MPKVVASVALGNEIKSDGLTLLDGLAGAEGTIDDGRTEVALAGGTVCRRMRHIKTSRGGNGFWRGPDARETDLSAKGLCLRADNPSLWNAPKWVEIEYYDEGLEYVRVNTCDGVPPEPNRWFHLVDSGSWQTVVIEIPALKSGGGLPLDADIRLESDIALHIRSVNVLDSAPEGFVSCEASSRARCIEVLSSNASHGMFMQIGNIGSIENASDEADFERLLPWLAIYKGLGATAIQSYVKWSRVETSEGVCDWEFYDRGVEELRKHDLRWVIFVMVGQSYSVPKWAVTDDKAVFATCVEHNQPSGVQSIWNPEMLPMADRWLKMLSDHVDHDMVEGIMLGPSGDFGETTYNGKFIKNVYHTHVGHWCADKYACDDFRRFLSDRYDDVSAINAAWGANYSAVGDITPLQQSDAPSDAAWMDQITWTVNAMTDFAGSWAEMSRRHFPKIPIYHAAGGAGDPIRGSNWSDQTKVSLPHDVGARVTNEGADYEFNYVYTNWQATACRFYGTPFGNEPWGGDMCGNGVVGRAFNAINSYADHFWLYYSHVATPDGLEGLRRSLRHLKPRPDRKIDVAVYYPFTHFKLTDENGFSEAKPRSLFWPKLE